MELVEVTLVVVFTLFNMFIFNIISTLSYRHRRIDNSLAKITRSLSPMLLLKAYSMINVVRYVFQQAVQLCHRNIFQIRLYTCLFNVVTMSKMLSEEVHV